MKISEIETEKALSRIKHGGYPFAMKPRTHKLERWARYFANQIRNVQYFEDEIHCGITPSSKTGDYSDVKVVTPYGEIPWTDVSRISDKEMHILMVNIQNTLEITLRLYEANKDNGLMNRTIEKSMFGEYGVSWDIPEDKWRELNNNKKKSLT